MAFKRRRSMFGRIMRRFFQRPSPKHKGDLQMHSRKGAAGAALRTDSEASLRPRVFGREALHTAPEDPTQDGSPTSGGPGRSTLKVMAKFDTDHEYVQDILQRRDRVGDEARWNGEDEEEAIKAHAKTTIMEAASNADLLLKAELLIGEDWLGKIEFINGNIYRIGALAGLIDISEGGRRTRCSGVARLIGCGLVFLFQIFGPLLIFMSCVFGVGREENEMFHWEHWWLWNSNTSVDMFYDWNHIATTKFVGMCFLEVFILNALFVTQDERKAEEKVWDIFGHLKRNTPNYEVHGTVYLFMGSFVNNWMVVVCTLDAYMIIGASRTPSDLFLDSLALLFLFNLDDIGGSLGFVDEDDWPGDRIAWIHSEIVKAPSEDDELNMSFKEKFNRYTNMGTYSIAFYFCAVSSVVMPICTAVTPFLMIAPAD